VLRFAAFDEPFVFIAGVIDDQVENQSHVPFLDSGKKLVEVGHGAELRHDLAIVADIIAIVRIG